MCGRFRLDENEDARIKRIFINIRRDFPNLNFKTGEVFPSETVPVLLSSEQAIPLKWGSPHFKEKSLIINARAETVATNFAFRDSFSSRRCVVATSGFYEWDSTKNKYLIRSFSAPVLYLGGIFMKGEGLDRFVIVTTAANDCMQKIHSRMPIIVPEDSIDYWCKDVRFATSLLASSMPELQLQNA